MGLKHLVLGSSRRQQSASPDFPSVEASSEFEGDKVSATAEGSKEGVARHGNQTNVETRRETYEHGQGLVPCNISRAESLIHNTPETRSEDGKDDVKVEEQSLVGCRGKSPDQRYSPSGLHPHNMRIQIRKQLGLLVLVISLAALAVVAIATMNIASNLGCTFCAQS